MPKYLIKYGLHREDDYVLVIEAETLEEAEDVAYQMCMEEAQCAAMWSAEEYSDEEGEEN
jgi:hypothetical protein